MFINVNRKKIFIVSFFWFFLFFLLKRVYCKLSQSCPLKTEIVHLTIPEGKNIKQTANIIAKKINIDKTKFINIAKSKNLEGYLMPETYFIKNTINEEQIIKKMFNEFKNKITPNMYKRAKNLKIKFKDIIILASIIEKESAKPEERAKISAVFYNRLNNKIKLQSCATVLYAIGVNKSKLTIKDVKINSPYNTYKYFGLPPGPICSPGIASINAALYPTKSNDFFFVSTGHGTHLFAKSFNEHKKNKQIARKINKIK
ncbi:MAG: endolytic transglycosylase MltG [Endomicrobium sp.]|jgi:UPF0755 protein|nr:endolytic transglycosylase MltG [Endomicrobium sp.]